MNSSPATLDPDVIATLSRVSTATITTLLLKKGLRNVWIRRALPLRRGGPRIVGRAFTLRFIPGREDLATPAAWASPRSTRVAVESMPAGCVAVADAAGVVDAGIFGDILCARMAVRGVAGLVTDGVVRDIAGVEATGLPVWALGTAAPSSATGLIFVNWQEPVGCGGVAVYPGDIIVADDDGAVVVPEAYLPELLSAGPEQERLEAWIMEQVMKGAELPGLYPANEATLARFRAEDAQR
jgi:regulator of RNase E activity RraA